ncbi:4-oxalmesaconate hydratase [Planctomycetes bacterium Pan216]|uniref:4-oxalmesaconate hydratase n=1 Tax=Kolteria novifilia TaxID=2527975 RepID=A0A518B4M9_9BACT|nr:4-oxalmesaconate hydratase [Planctomycetes bacterium Pan216]
MTKRAFAVVAHPDDIEFVMAGTLLRLGEAGYELHYMNVSNGCCGSNDLDRETIARIRTEEAKAAAKILGAIFHEPISEDLEIFYDRPTLRKLGSVMRNVAPDLLLLHSPVDYMVDHENACKLAVTAAFSRGMKNFPVDPPREPVGNPLTIYHAQPHGNKDPLGKPVTPTHYVDVSSVIETKVNALYAHESQRKWLDETQGLDSYTETMKELGREVGTMSGQFEYAEGFRKHSYLGFGEEGADPLAEALGASCLIPLKG